MIHQFPFAGQTIEVEDGLLPNNTADQTIPFPYILFRNPNTPPESSVRVRVRFNEFEPKYQFKQIVTKWTIENIDITTGEPIAASPREQYEGEPYFYLFFNSPTGAFPIGYVATRASLNNALERFIYQYFGDEPFICFFPQAGYQFFEPLQIETVVTISFPDVENYDLAVYIPNLPGHEFEYRINQGAWQTSPNFTIPAGEYSLSVRDNTQSDARGFDVVGMKKVVIEEEQPEPETQP
jgi:hypothetical protein